MSTSKKPWECDNEIEKIISINQYSEDFEVLKQTIKLESDMNIRSTALLLILKIKPMDAGEITKFLSNDVGLSVDEGIELLNHAINVAEQLQN